MNKKADKGVDMRGKMLITKQNPPNFASSVPTVGEVKPTFGVRMKNKLKGETGRVHTKSSRHDPSPD